MQDAGKLWAEQLRLGLGLLNINVTPVQADLFCRYLALLARWNKTYNLTAVRDPQSWVQRHILDSLSIAPFVHKGRVLDVGTGAGLPGIPLAIMRTEDRFVLLDSNGKKTRFVQQALIELGLKNCSVEQQRIESYSASDKFDTITARAFSSLSDLLEKTWHLLGSGGRIVAMKGRKDSEQINAMPVDSQPLKQVDLAVPGEQAARHVIIIDKK